MRNEWDEGRSGNGQGRELTIRDASYLCPSSVTSGLSPLIRSLRRSVMSFLIPFPPEDTERAVR